MKARQGFGLAEIIITILLIAMFAAFAIVSFAQKNKTAPYGQHFGNPVSKVIF